MTGQEEKVHVDVIRLPCVRVAIAYGRREATRATEANGSG